MGIPANHPAILEAMKRGLIQPAALGGTSPGRPAPSPAPIPAAPLPWALTLTVAVRVVSEANRRGHWSGGAKRAKAQRQAVADALKPFAVPTAGRFRVILTHLHRGRPMDDDNLSRACKAIRDQVSMWLQVDDGNTARIRFRCRQEPGPGAVRITIRGER